LMRCNLPGQVGTCASAAAAAPTLTPWGLIFAALLLTGVAAFALRYRMRGR
jgi:MYXO-CTERM domain-containing protein